MYNGCGHRYICLELHETKDANEHSKKANQCWKLGILSGRENE